MAGRSPETRKQASAIARSVEGMVSTAASNDRGRNDDVSVLLNGEPDGEQPAGTSHPGSASAAEQPDQASSQTAAEIAPRFDSLVAYPPAPAGDSGAESAEPIDDPLSRKLEGISVEPGVYLLKDRNGKVLYVGKAKSLRSRVR